jgi:hypothetical protein
MTQIKKSKLHVQSIQSIQTSKVGSHYLFFTKCALFLLKIGEGLTLIIIKMKGLELMKFSFKTNLSTFGSNMFFDFENYGF